MRPLSSGASLSGACTGFVQDLTYEAIPPEALDRAKLHLADLLACIIRGTDATLAGPAREYTRATGGAPQAALVGEKNKGPIGQAAFFNGYCGHIMEMDDVDRESITHPATVIIPAALAVGELRDASGRDLLTAIVAGYEVMLRIGAAITPGHYAIWHTTGTAGAFGAAMAAGKLFGLSRPELDWALGNAGTMAAGLWQFNLDG
ncbi:MAG: MmgE/PrpD family protein, partial [Desulfovibrionaceae bacterium]|nr:MmgE/PrpD family protein [Desulfovibrionaceae bacterium]